MACVHTMKATGQDGITRCCDCGKLLRGRVKIPEPTPDQIEYLRNMQAAVSDYDPDYVVRGRRPEDCK